ncbi:MAG TPA: hypothetical protein VNW30_07250 [Opitutaceae bacterium]|jgi:hypothetical protein|nr:hypothetical protein [Opitutaceae bacterium]
MPKPTIKIDRPHQLVADFREKGRHVRLNAGEWKMLLELDGEKPFRAVCAQFAIEAEAMPGLLTRFKRLGLVVESRLNLDEFLKQRGLSELPASIVTAPSAETLDAVEIIEVVIGGSGPTTAPVAMNQTEVMEFTLGANPSAAAPADPPMDEVSSDGLRLKPLIDFIVKHAGGGTVGQLAVYRVFLKVPLNLLHGAKIRSLQLVDETFEIHSPPLAQIILAAVRETLGVEYVPSMAGAA